MAIVATPSLAQTEVNPLITYAKMQEIPRVGEVFVMGNTITQDRVIRRELQGLQPGQILRPAELKIAEQNLKRLGIFTCATVQALNSPGPFKDLMVKVEEKSTRRFWWNVAVDSLGQPVIQLWMDDSNFDPFRWPTSFEDESAFRGGGMNVRLELVRLNIFQLRLELLANGRPQLASVWRYFTDY
jgi:outer membrane protein assembly factor BamA